MPSDQASVLASTYCQYHGKQYGMLNGAEFACQDTSLRLRLAKNPGLGAAKKSLGLQRPRAWCSEGAPLTSRQVNHFAGLAASVAHSLPLVIILRCL
jgi:hypothetical protein